MIKELPQIIIFLLGFLAVAGVIAWLAMVFQAFIFQRYRLNKNEAAMRKTRLHDQEQERSQYRQTVLGVVDEKDKKS